jgi:hypothetical protein
MGKVVLWPALVFTFIWGMAPSVNAQTPEFGPDRPINHKVGWQKAQAAFDKKEFDKYLLLASEAQKVSEIVELEHVIQIAYCQSIGHKAVETLVLACGERLPFWSLILAEDIGALDDHKLTKLSTQTKEHGQIWSCSLVAAETLLLAAGCDLAGAGVGLGVLAEILNAFLIDCGVDCL